MKSIVQILFFCITITLISCKEDKVESANTVEETNITTLYLIRHSEKDRSNPENVDPELTQDGLGRAMHWAEILEDVELDAIYSTDYNRTSMTAAPISVKQNIDVTYYNVEDITSEQFLADNINKNVLVVGHSNSTPELVNKLIGHDKYSSIDDHENGVLFIVKIINGIASESKLEFNCNCPD